MDIQNIDPNRAKNQQKAQKVTDDAIKFTSVFGQKAAELQQQRVMAAEDIQRYKMTNKEWIETGEGMDSEDVAEELLLKKKKKLSKKVEDLLRSQQQGLGL